LTRSGEARGHLGGTNEEEREKAIIPKGETLAFQKKKRSTGNSERRERVCKRIEKTLMVRRRRCEHVWGLGEELTSSSASSRLHKQENSHNSREYQSEKANRNVQRWKARHDEIGPIGRQLLPHWGKKGERRL